MKEEAFLRRRFSLCPPASTPHKTDPRKLTRTLLLGGENELSPVSPAQLHRDPGRCPTTSLSSSTGASGILQRDTWPAPWTQPSWKDMEPNGLSLPRDEEPPTLGSTAKVPPAENRLCNGSDKECVSPTSRASRKETLKAQKETYRKEKKRATKQLFSALTDPSVVIMADSLKIRGTLKSWTKLWCVLKPGVLLIYKTPKVGQWVGTVLLHCCELIERPSKKDGFCFKLFHPLDQSVWAVKGPKGESVGSITQPLPSSYLIFRAASESDGLLHDCSPGWGGSVPTQPAVNPRSTPDVPWQEEQLQRTRSHHPGRCWLDALELALRCSSLLRLSACKQGHNSEPGSSPDASPSSLSGLPGSAAVHPDQDLFPLSGPSLGSPLEQDAFSDKSENAEDSGAETQDPSRKTNGSGSDQSESPGEPHRGTTYVEQAPEGPGELDEEPQVETVSEENKGLIWVLLRQLRPGMDLSRVVLPTFVLEPRSFLSKLSDHYCHADLLSRAAREDNAYGRMKLVLRWYLSGFYKKPKGIKKPYNPVLGEMFRCCWIHPQTRSCTFYIAEQVSHHPPVTAFHVSNRKDGFCISGSIVTRSKFYGNSLSALLDGKATLTFLDRAEDYTLTMPYAHCRGILYGTMTLELGGSVTIACEKNDLQAQLDFKLKPFFGGSTSINQISGKIRSGENVLAHLTGHWDRDVFIQEEGSGSAELFWTPSREVRRQSLKRHTVLFEEQMEMESERLWQHVTRAIHEGDQHRATQEKCVLEEAQRQRTREHQQGLTPWTPQLFHLDPLTHKWRYRYENHSPWNPLKDVTQFEQDGILHTLQRETGAHKTSFLGSPESGRERSGPDRRLRKASDQPSGHSQVTESSGSTPESCPEISDEDCDSAPADDSPCPRCRREAQQLQALREAMLSIREAQEELHRHLSAMLSSVVQAGQPAPGLLQSPRTWFLLCVFLACQLFINYILK
ncbi:oxysterol-binding protein-related protein 5 isoform X2 [Marmota monax]|nr:oxysterol-binding protein-related protein 5 isoform X2 [Marmota monax]XP_046300855.1 oxysterol-binding protein-related protein 5 isoform X2 [Marmota monax]XP_046300857.1 oxysterol-binding protein-related protein 5 isoform X2 [Marmota monax]XP_046300858.1 oxysterol-binding protein-related protein 5 isoform X2 [Marmota monax]